MNAKLMSAVAAVGLMIGAGAVNAQLVTYSFTGANATSGAPDAQPANASASNVSQGSGLLDLNVTDRYGFEGVTNNGSIIDLNDYIEFTLDANPGFHLSVTRIDFTSDRDFNGWKQMAIRSNLDGFASNLATASRADSTTDVNHQLTLSPSVVNQQNAVVFRIYAFDSDTEAGDSIIDNLVVQGSVAAVPEPAALGLLGLGVTALLRRRA